MKTENWVNIGSGNGLLPDGTKPLPVRSGDIHRKASSQEIPQPSITEIIWKIKYIKFHSNFPGANELKKKRCHKTPTYKTLSNLVITDCRCLRT